MKEVIDLLLPLIVLLVMLLVTDGLFSLFERLIEWIGRSLGLYR